MRRKVRPIPSKETHIYLAQEEARDVRKFLTRVVREALASLGLKEEDALAALPLPDSTWTEEDRMEIYEQPREVVGEREARAALEELPKALPPSPGGMWVGIYVKRGNKGGKWYAFEVSRKAPVQA